MSATPVVRVARTTGKMSIQLSWGIIMKSLVLFTLSVVATAAMAASPVGPGPITISGTSVQVAVLSNSTSSNKAEGRDALAQQSIASNAGKVNITGTSVQVVAALSGSAMTNRATSEATAEQNIASNVGDVTIGGTSVQVAVLNASTASNLATGRDAVAVQNIASNNACYACASSSVSHGH